MTDLAKIITDSVSAIASPEIIREKVDKAVDKLVTAIITDELRSYGEISKTIKEALKESLQVTDLNLPSYSTMITQMLRTQIEAQVSPLIAGALAKDMEDILSLAPKTVKLSEIVEDMMENYLAYEDGTYGDIVTCIVEVSNYGSTWIYLDDTKHYSRSNKYQCDCRILLSKDGTISSASFRNIDITGKRRSPDGGFAVGSVYGLAQKIQAYHACGTVIEVDEDNVSTYRDYD